MRIVREGSGNRKTGIKSAVVTFLDDFEEVSLILASRLGPWLAPVGPSYFIGRAVAIHLTAHWAIAAIMAIANEAVGIAATKTTLRAWIWNQQRREGDPQAPLSFSLWLVFFYFLTGLILAVGLEVQPELTPYAPGAFFILTAIGYFSLATAANLTRWEKSQEAELTAADHQQELLAEVEILASEVEKLTVERDKLAQENSRLKGQIQGQNNGKSSFGPHNLPQARQSKQAEVAARRQQVLELAEAGKTVAEMADLLAVSESTIKTDKQALNGQIRRAQP